MKLLVITAFYPPHHSGGFELRCKDVVEGLQARGHEASILTNRCPERACRLHPNEKGIHRCLHQRLESTPVLRQIGWDRTDLKLIDRFTRECAPDLIYLWHIQNLSNAILPYFSARGIPIVFDEGGSGIAYLARVHKRGIYFYKNERDSNLKKWLKACIYQAARWVSGGLVKPDWVWPEKMRVYFNSHSAREHALKQGAPVEESTVIHSGIDLSRFRYQAREKLNLPVKIIYPARVKALKGTLDGIHLVQALRDRGIPARLRLVGEVQDDAYLMEINRSIAANGLSEEVSLQPMVSQADLARLYREADFCFFPTYFKSGFSRVPLEAMASGCVVLSYGNEGSREAVKDYENGFIVTEGDALAAAQRIEELINNPDLYVEITRQARAIIEREHSMDQYVEKIELFLLESLAKHDGG